MPAEFEIYEDVAHEWRLRPVDGKHNKVASFGEWFASKSSAKRAAENVRETAPSAGIVEKN
jgi:uncharacterized protein YegP (UPF0339 family)